jgi:hypothetical protein
VMACAVNILGAGGIGAGKPQLGLGRLKNPELCRTTASD